MKRYLLLLIFGLLIACTPQSEPVMMEKQDGAMQSDKPVALQQDPFITQEPIVSPGETPVMDKHETFRPIAGDVSKYYHWNNELFEQANEEGKLIYLEFSANWCPICKQQEKDLVAAFETLDNPNVIGFKIPYKDSETTDEHTALARKYGIAYQHTKVIIKDGKILLKSPEAWNTERFLTEVNQLG